MTEVKKEYVIAEYKFLDDGYYIHVFIPKIDEFGNKYFYLMNRAQYKEEPTNKQMSLLRPTSSIDGDYYEFSMGMLLKTMVEEYRNLQFHSKMDKEINEKV